MGEEVILKIGEKEIHTKSYFERISEVYEVYPEKQFCINHEKGKYYVSSRLLDAIYECRKKGKVIPI